MELVISFFLLICSVVKGQVFDYPSVTCGSVLKLVNTATKVRLHSHDVKYGSGSGQQSVTAVHGSDDHNSYWVVRSKIGTECFRGTPVKCGQTVRFQHLTTKKNLHSHHFSSPLSHNLEVSAFGDEGQSDEGDHWVVVCGESQSYWDRQDKVRIKHVVTDAYLHVNGDQFGRPIHGQLEVSGYNYATDQNTWVVGEGIFVKPSSEPEKVGARDDYKHTEL